MITITDDMSAHEAALVLAAADIYVFPVDHPDSKTCTGLHTHEPDALTCTERGKVPAVKFTEKATTKDKVIHAWWTFSSYNVGVNVGKSGLIVIDEDVPGGFAKYAADHGVTVPPTFTVKTAKGRHYYYRDTQNGALGNHEGALADYGINVRSGNAYVVGPGSKRTSGAIYRVERDLPIAPIPGWAVDAINAKTNGHKPSSGNTGWEDVRTDDFDRFELPEVIKDGKRDDTLFRYGSSLLARNLRRSEMKELMELAWKRCEQPPAAKTSYTLEKALEKLDRYHPGPSEGYEQPDSDQQDADADDPASFDSLVAKEAVKIRVREAARELVDASKRPPVAPFDAGTLGEILAWPPEPKARIADLVPWEAGTLITAQRKTGKTTFVGNLCRSLINGGAFLGCFQVRPLNGNIAMLNYEMPSLQLAHWFDDMRISHSGLHLNNLRARANPLATEEGRANLAAWIRSRDIEAIIYDPFGRAYTGKSQNDPGEVGAWLADLDRFTRGECGARDLFLTAHAGWDGERTRGASALEDWADSIITLTRDSGEDGSGARYVRAIGRDVNLEEDQLRFHRDERYLDLARTGSRKATAEKRKAETLRTAILEIVSGQPGINGTEVERELRDAGVTFQRGDHRAVLKALVDEGELTVEPGKRGAKCYQTIQVAQVAQPSPDVAHGLGGGPSPARPIEDGLGTTNSGPPDTQPETGLAESPPASAGADSNREAS